MRFPYALRDMLCIYTTRKAPTTMTPVPAPPPPVDLYAAHRDAQALLRAYLQADQARLLLHHYLLDQRVSTALLVHSAGLSPDLAQCQVGQLEEALAQAQGRALEARRAWEQAAAPLLPAGVPVAVEEPLSAVSRALLGTLETVRRMIVCAGDSKTREVSRRWLDQALRDLHVEMEGAVRTRELADELDDEASVRMRAAAAYCAGE